MARTTRRLQQAKPASESQPMVASGSSRGPSPPPSKRPAPRSKYKARTLDLSPGEDFTLNLNDLNLNASDSAEESAVPPQSPSSASVQPTAGSSPAATRPASPDLNEPPPPRSSSRKALDVDYFFEPQFDRDGKPTKKKICKPCRQLSLSEPATNYLYSSSTSSGTRRNHLGAAHGEEYNAWCNANGWINRFKATSKSGISATSELQAQVTPFSQRAFEDLLVNFITADDQSINVVECREFRDLLQLLRPGLHIPHRTRTKEVIFDAWREQFVALKEELGDALGKISFTADIWSNQSRRPFLAVTAHWLAKEKNSPRLQLKTTLIGFHCMRGSHSGERIAKVVLHILDRIGITVNVGHWTLDNAENNVTFMKALERELVNNRDVTFHHLDNRIRCFPHIINLCTSRAIESFGGSFSRAEREESDGEESDDPCNPIAKCRSFARAVRASGARHEKFLQAIQLVNNVNTLQIRELELLQDCKTRWDSTYKMIVRFKKLRPAIGLFQTSEAGVADFKMTEKDWEALDDIDKMLEVPHHVQQSMSAERTPSLTGAIACFELFMTTWECLRNENSRLAPHITAGRAVAVKYYHKMDETRAYAITMFLNPSIRLRWIEKHWGENYTATSVEIIKTLMGEYYDRARALSESARPKLAPVLPNKRKKHCMFDLAQHYNVSDMTDFLGSTLSEQTIDEEYLSYSMGLLESRDFTDADILTFWETNKLRFPTLFAIALDYLPIQASAVPCERVFSSSAETDTKRRNRIHPLLMEALQLLKFSLKRKRLDFMDGWGTNYSEMLSHADDEPDLLAEISDPKSRLDKVIAAVLSDNHDALEESEDIDVDV